MRGQSSFNACNQLRNADWLGQKWMSVDLQARSGFSSRDERRQKDNRCSVQRRIRFNPRSNFAAIDLRHRNIKKNEVRLEALCCLMGRGWFVLFLNGVAPGPLQPEFSRKRKIAVVIND